MARKPMVTRTIKSTKAIVLCMDVVAEEPCNITVLLPRTYKDDKDLMKAVKAEVDSVEIKAVHVVSTEIETNLYGMSEADFIKNAVILPAKNTNTETDPENDI